MIGRVLLGARISAAEQARALHLEHIKAIAALGRLAMPVEAAADHAMDAIFKKSRAEKRA